MGNILRYIRQKINTFKKSKRSPPAPSPSAPSITVPSPPASSPRVPSPPAPSITVPSPPVSSPRVPSSPAPSLSTPTSPELQKRQVNALLIVDVQYDFIDGTLALKNCPSQHQGEHVIPILNKLLEDIRFDIVVYTQDWHTPDHISFYDNLHLRAHLLAKDSKPIDELKVFDTAIFVFEDDVRKARVEQILWPVHCIQHTHGAELHKDLVILKPKESCQVVNLLKGYDSDIDSYSAFWDNQKIRETMLNTKLKENNVTQVFIGGIATDVCVYSTALHAVENGYKTYIIEDACRGVDENNIHLRLDELIAKNCLVTQAANIKNLV